MRNNSFKLNSVYMAMLLATTATVQAEEVQNNQAANDDVEVIQVSGIRGSLNKAAAIKRDSFGVVDAISAEDIGKFPDTNLAESLQRITGVSIDRANNEGNQITVRGFGPSFNLVTLNGRQMPNSSVIGGVNRSFNFREIASETVNTVEVHKTAKAHVSTGGVGATVDVQTAKPFDYGEFKAFAGLKGVADTSVEDGSSVTPEISGMISNVFADGKFGVLFSASHSKRDSHRDRVGTDGWVRNRGNRDQINTSNIDTTRNPEQAFWTPWTAVVEHFDTERERQNAQLVLQAAPVDSVVATFDYTLSRFEEVSNTNRAAYWFDDPFGDTDENGTVWNPTDPDDELNFWAWQYYEKKENDSLGLNIEWQATDTLAFTFDYHDSTSHSNPDGTTSETLANLKNPKFNGNGVDISGEFIGDIPAVGFDDSKIPGSAYDKANIVSDLYQQRGIEMENNIKQTRISGVWENQGSGALAAINFGYQNTQYEVEVNNYSVFQFVDIPLTNLDLSFEPLGNTADQFSGSENLFPQIPKYSALQFVDIVDANNVYVEPSVSTNGVEEDTTSLYFSLDFETEFNDLPVAMNVGLRYEDTEVTSFSVQNGVRFLNFRHPEELEQIRADEATKQELEGGYTRVLPNFDMQIDLTEDLVGRVSYGRTIGRPSIGSLFPGTNLNAPRPEGPFRASQGNPNLLPLTSDNIDVSLEYYLDDGSYLSIGYFKKFVENFIGDGIENRTINDVNGVPLTDPSTDAPSVCPDSVAGGNPACFNDATDPVITWEVSTPLNLQNRKVDGWELGSQYMFGETGFGGQINYTMVDSDERFEVFNFDQTVALSGLSDSGNLVGFYENDELQVRVAYNWRDDFLQGLGNEPTFVEAYGQWDMSVSYDIDEQYSVFFDGINLTNETARSHGRFKNQLLSAEQYGPRFAFGIRGSW